MVLLTQYEEMVLYHLTGGPRAQLMILLFVKWVNSLSLSLIYIYIYIYHFTYDVQTLQNTV